MSMHASRIHSRYSRSPHDLPVSEHTVRLVLHARRFRCPNTECSKSTFVERLAGLLPYYGRRTHRLTRALRSVGRALGGEAGVRLLQHLRMHSSPRTLLRIVRQQVVRAIETPRVLGVDDWAIRKGRTYGTILVDLERRQTVDLLPGRDAETLTKWLQEHQGIEIIARDRSTEYIRAINNGAPSAQQVAGALWARWHLLQNLRQMLERCLNRLLTDRKTLPLLRIAPSLAIPSRAGPFLRSRAERKSGAATHRKWMQIHQEVHRLHRDGHNISQISRTLQIDRKIVRKYLSMAQLPVRARHPVRMSTLDPYLAHLVTRFHEGCTNGMQLWREIREQGYAGGYGQVIRWLKKHRQQLETPTAHPHDPSTDRTGNSAPEASASLKLPSNRQLSWLLLLDAGSYLGHDADLVYSLQQYPVLNDLQQLVQRFKTIVRERKSTALDTWLSDCATSEFPELQTFATGLMHDYSAVRAAVETDWSNWAD